VEKSSGGNGKNPPPNQGNLTKRNELIESNLPQERSEKEKSVQDNSSHAPYTTPDTIPTGHGLDTLPAVRGPDNGASGHTHDTLTPAHSEAFEHFWAVYPRREKKEAARTEFLAAVEAGTNPNLIVTVAGRYAVSVAGKEARYIAGPANWLRDKRWTDDYHNTRPVKQSWSEQLASCRVVNGKVVIN
jgi:hypothetical protein